MKDKGTKPLIVQDYETLFERNSIEYIQIYDNIFTQEECKDYIAFHDKHSHKPDWVYKGKVGHFVQDDNKKQSLDLSLESHSKNKEKSKKVNPYMELFGRRIWGYLTLYLTKTVYWGAYPYINFLNSQEAVKLHEGFGLTNVNLRKYDKNTGGYFVPHYDNQGSGHQFRSIAIICYLNTLEYGGETIFPALNRSVRPREGRIVIFPSNFTYLHYGNSSPEDRYIISGHLLHDKRKDPQRLDYINIYTQGEKSNGEQKKTNDDGNENSN